MNLLKSAAKQSARARLLASLALCAACASSPSPSNQEADIVGAPPPRHQDPFASAMPLPEEARAPTSGVFELDPAPEPKAASTPVPPQPTATRGVMEVEAPAPVAPPTPAPAQEPAPTPVAEPEPVAPLTVAIATSTTRAPDPAPSKPAFAQCFSCVKICPMHDGAPRCEGAAEDTICGWGSAAKPEQAKQRAVAECDGALDMAREMPRWRMIEGACPVATCR